MNYLQVVQDFRRIPKGSVWPRCSPWIKRFMGDPCDEVLRNHSKGSRKRFYTLWTVFCLLHQAENGHERTFVWGQDPVNIGHTRCLPNLGRFRFWLKD